MTPAPTCLFEIPELAAVVTSLLDPKDILQLMQTYHRMHATMEPWFYHHLMTIYASDYLCESPEGQRVLARNIHYVRTWLTDLMNLIFFLHATTTTTTATTFAPPLLTTGESLPPPILVPLPPMTNVTKLALRLCRDTPLKKASENLPFKSLGLGQGYLRTYIQGSLASTFLPTLFSPGLQSIASATLYDAFQSCANWTFTISALMTLEAQGTSRRHFRECLV